MIDDGIRPDRGAEPLAAAVDEPETGRAAGGLCVDRLGSLPSGTILDERALAAMFGCSTATIKRAVQRSELPAPVRMFGRPVWTAGAILRHVEARLVEAQKVAERDAERFSRLVP